MSGIGVDNDNNISAADGSTTVFTYTFYAYDASQVKVYSVLNDEFTPITSGITITPNSDFIGGTVTFSVAPAAAVGDILRRREVPYTQTTEFNDLIRYKETSIERALNTIVMQIQQLKSRVFRSLAFSEAAGTSDTVVEEPVDGAALIFDGTTGRIIAGPTASDIAGAQSYAEQAAAALAACQTIYDNFDDRYLGQKSSAPSVDNDGNALIDGALYYNTADNKMYVYDLGTTTWLAIETNIPDGSITNAKLASGAVDGGKLAANAVVDGTKVQNGILDYAKLASSAFGSVADLIAGTASKLVDAATLESFFSAGIPLQTKYAVTTTADSTAVNIPFDNTIPQNTEGKEITPLNITITPKKADSLLVIDVRIPFIDVSANNVFALALFQDSIADALTVALHTPTNTAYYSHINLRFVVVAGSTTARTYKVRYGMNTGTAYLLRSSGSATVYGNIQQASMIVTEIAQ